MRTLLVGLFCLVPLWADAAGSSAAVEIARGLREIAIDPGECYRVRELHLVKGSVRLYLTSGTLAFAKPVAGRRIAAVFSTELEEGGDAELMALPPTAAERRSMSSFAGAPNLTEHFRSALFYFTDGTEAELRALLREHGQAATPETGLLLSRAWDSTVRNIGESLATRLVQDVATNRPERGFFFASLATTERGTVDLHIDPRSPHLVTLGQATQRDGVGFFDVWSRFEPKGSRRVPAPGLHDGARLGPIRLEATIHPDLRLQVRMSAQVQTTPEFAGAVALDLSNRMRITQARWDGQPVAYFQRDSLRARTLRGSENDTVVVLPENPVPSGTTHELEMELEGNVISRTGTQVFFVGARTNWYPRSPVGFAPYSLQFRFPRTLDLVATGERVEEREEGEWRIQRRETRVPVRVVGFNLGHYRVARVSRNGFNVEVFSNQATEPALQPRVGEALPMSPPSPFGRNGRRPFEVPSMQPLPPPNPAARLQELAGEVTGALTFYAGLFGPPAMPALTVSPIAGTFGQGFPGLIYLSTYAYLAPQDRPAALRSGLQETFFSSLLLAHETAHQWWGNVLASAGPEDEWLMESLANYSALLYLEKQRGRKALDEVLLQYRDRLLAPTAEGSTLESTGPITWGPRLRQSQAPQAWLIITYEKGSWILHMLRQRMGDSAFLSLLQTLRNQYAQRAVSTREFQALAATQAGKTLPARELDAFFAQWVYGTGVPTLKLSYALAPQGSQVKVTGTLTAEQSGGEFNGMVPIEAHYSKGAPSLHWVSVAGESTPIRLTLARRPTKLSISPARGVLAK